MKQCPSRLKFKKYHKVSKSLLFLREQKVFFPAFGNFAIKNLVYSRLHLKQLEACRKSVRRKFRKTAFLKLRPFTYHSVTKKSLGSRMGSGKGQHSVWVCPSRAGSIICELVSLVGYKSMNALKGASSKLPVKTKIITLKY